MLNTQNNPDRETLFPAKEKNKASILLIQGSKKPIKFDDNKLLSIS